jgi:hypothetical protein
MITPMLSAMYAVWIVCTFTIPVSNSAPDCEKARTSLMRSEAHPYFTGRSRRSFPEKTLQRRRA